LSKTILLIGDSIYPDSMGGSHRHIYELAVNLLNKGFKVVVITPKQKQIAKEYELIDGIDIYRYKRNKDNKIKGFIDYIIEPYKLYKKLEEQYHFDVIHGHWALTCYLIFKFSKNGNKFFTLHGPMFEEYKYELTMNPILKRIILNIMRLIEKRVIKKAKRVITASKYMSDKLKKIYGQNNNVTIIPVPTNTIKFKPKYKNKQLAKKALNLGDGIVLLTVRRLQKRMGINNLIIAFKQLVPKFPNKKINLIIGGNGPIKQELSELISNLHLENEVSLAGFLPEDELPLYYEAADLFIIPSIDLEGFGLVTTEAMAVGTTVIATPVGGNKEIMEKYNSNFLTESIDSDSIFNKLVEIMNKTDEFSYDQKCRDFVLENYSWKRNIENFINIYEGTENDRVGSVNNEF
jgi:glycosyltransferase involved in cell wall biosynthesis